MWVSSRIRWPGATTLESHRISGTGLLSTSPCREETSPLGITMPHRLLKISLYRQIELTRIMAVQVELEGIA
jgi:hypothetical protein